MGRYVDITNVPDSFLSFMGYILIAEDDQFKVYTCKGEEIIIRKSPPVFLYVDDENDVQILKGYRSLPSPPWN